MSDSIALARLIFSRSRTQLVVWIAWLFISIIISLMVGELFGKRNVMPSICLTTFPLFVWSLAMFEFGHTERLMAGESGYSHWLMRMPIANHQLAAVPLLMRFVWLGFIYYAIYLTTGLLSGIWLPAISGIAILLAGGAWVSAIGWRPFRGAWRRVFVIVVTCVAYYLLFAAVMSVHFDDFTDIDFLRAHPVATKTTTWSLVLIGLVSGVWTAFQSLRLARFNTTGLIPEQDTKFVGWLGRVNEFLSPSASKTAMHRNQRSALAWHDLRRVLLRGERWTLFLTVAGLVLFVTFLPLTIANAMFLMFFFCQLGVMTGSAVLEPTQLRGSSLPTYVATSPLTCAEIGFTRGITAVWTSYIGVTFIALAYLICLLMPYNQKSLANWIDQTAAFHGHPLAAYRWMALIAIAVVVMVPSRSLGFVWPTLTGRSRLALTALTLPILTVFLAGSIVTYWFLQQTDWETAIANAWYWASWIPTLLVTLLSIKLAATCVAAYLSANTNLLKPKTISVIIVCWFIATLLIATVCHALIPDDRVLFVWTLMVTALIVPIGRVLILPYSVYLNRYR